MSCARSCPPKILPNEFPAQSLLCKRTFPPRINYEICALTRWLKWQAYQLQKNQISAAIPESISWPGTKKPPDPQPEAPISHYWRFYLLFFWLILADERFWAICLSPKSVSCRRYPNGQTAAHSDVFAPIVDTIQVALGEIVCCLGSKSSNKSR